MADMQVEASSVATATQPSLKRTRGESLMDSFAEYRAELDSHYDRRERIIKQSRDITAQSKKLIFSAHRITNTDRSIVVKEVEAKLKELKKMFERLSSDVEGENFWRYEKSVSPGIQEYLEGLTFYHYLMHQSIPTLSETSASLLPPPAAPKPADPPAETPTEVDSAAPAPETEVIAAPDVPLSPFVRITIPDYLGGIADLTGEMMRLAIGSVGKSLVVPRADGTASAKSGDELPSIESIGKMVRDIKGEMDPLAPYCRWLGKKMTVLDQSLGKIESASYNLRIRGAEYAGAPPAMLASLADRGFGGEVVVA